MTVATTGCDTVFHFGYGQGVRGNIRRTYCTRKQTFVRGADPLHPFAIAAVVFRFDLNGFLLVYTALGIESKIDLPRSVSEVFAKQIPIKCA